VTTPTPTRLVKSPNAPPHPLTGSGYARGLTVEILLQGNTETYSGAALQGSSGTTFEIAVVLAQAGEANLVVRNIDGGVSEPFPFTVAAGPPPEPARPSVPTPKIDRVTPEQTPRSTIPQLVAFTGSNFASTATVTMTSPTGAVTVIPTNSLEQVTPTAITFKVALPVSGDYTFVVTNPPKQASNVVTVVVS
jgi:hypothetical protein